MKKLICLCLAMLLLLGCFTACGSNAPEETTAPTVKEPEGEGEVLRILTLGNSGTVDSCHLLNLVAAAEGYEGELYVGTLYYSGCKLYQHVNFIKSGEKVYNLYLSSSTTPNQPPQILDAVSMQDALTFQYWDIIILQTTAGEGDDDVAFTDGRIQFIQNYVREQVKNPNFRFAFVHTGVSASDPELIAMYPYSPNGYAENYAKYNNDRLAYYMAFLDRLERFVYTDETFDFIIPTGAAVMNVWTSYMTEKDIHRDYTHTTDFGRVVQAYCYYCRVAGIEQLEEIKLDSIPKNFLKSAVDKSQDRPLTEMEKAIILESVNNALANPLEVTQSQYTTAP